MKVVYYHLVTDLKFDFFNGITVSKKKFEEDLIHYKKYYNVITLKDIKKYQEEGKSLKNSLVITFDDGYKENFINTTELLEKYDLRATFFLNSSTVDNKKMMWRDALTYLGKKASNEQLSIFKKNINFPEKEDFDILKSTKDLLLEDLKIPIEDLWNDVIGINEEGFLRENQIYINSNDVSKLISSGHEIGVHSTYHPNFSTLSYQEGVKEVVKAYNYFIEKFNYKPISFSFPFGKKHNEKSFYEYLLANTTLKYFLGIDYNHFSNRKISENYFIERLGMEDGRSFFLSFYLRPLIRLIK